MNNINVKKTDSQLQRRKAILSYSKGNNYVALKIVRHIQRVSNEPSVKKKAAADAEYFKARAERQRKK